MATVQRNIKTFGTRAFVSEVAAAPSNYAPILSNEVDADLDTIYAAWNGGADTVNLKDGSITYAKLAPDAQLWRDTGTTLIPGISFATRDVAAAGSLTTGSTTAPAPTTPGIRITGAAAGLRCQGVGVAGADGYSSAIGFGWETATPSLKVRIDGTDWGSVITTMTGRLVTAAMLAPQATVRNAAVGNAPASFSTGGTTGSFLTVLTLPGIATLGGRVLILTNISWTYQGTSGDIMYLALYRDGASVFTRRVDVAASTGGTLTIPLPNLYYVDSPPAGSYVYSARVQVLAAGANLTTPADNAGLMQAFELT